MMKLHGAGMGNNPQRQLEAYTIALKAKKQIAEGTMAFVFEKPKEMRFEAGQHIRITLIDPPETDSEGNSRFFSLASSPSESDLIIAMRMSGSAFKRVLSGMPKGQKVLIQIMVHSHEGAFTLHKDVKRPAVFVIGGIGIVPAYAIIKDWAKQKLGHDITLIYSNRRPEDAPFLAELQKLSRTNPKLTLAATMTEPGRSKKQWHGQTGRINAALLGRYVDNTKKPIYYLAGLSDLVKAMQKMLIASGVDKSDIRSEEWGNFTMAHGSQTKEPSKLFIAIIVIVVIALLLLHIAAASSFTSLKGLLLYILSVIGITILLFKIKVISGIFKQKKGH